MIANFLFSLQLNCYYLNSSVIIDKQTNTLIFKAFPSQELTGEQQKMCQITLSNQMFDLQIVLGNQTYTKKQLIYSTVTPLETVLTCESLLCTYDNVKLINIAVFYMQFYELDIKIENIIGSFYQQLYDHNNCHKVVEFWYSTTHYELRFPKNVLSCLVKPVISQVPSTCNNSTSPKTDSGESVLFVTLMSLTGTPIYAEQDTPVICYQQKFPLSNVFQATMETMLTDLKVFGPLDVRMGVPPFVLKMIHDICNQKDFNPMHYEFRIKHELIQCLDCGTSTQQILNLHYNLTVGKYMDSQYFHIQEDCYLDVNVILSERFIYVTTTANSDQTKCNDVYLKSEGLIYDSVKFQFLASNIPSGGDKQFKIVFDTEYILSSEIDHVIECTDEKQCNEFKELLDMSHQFQNNQYSFQLVFYKENVQQFKTEYTPNVGVSIAEMVNITIYQNNFCVKFEPYSSDQIECQIQINDVEMIFQLSQELNVQTYCTQYKNEGVITQLLKINLQKDKINIKVFLDSNLVPQANIKFQIVYKSNYYWYIMCGIYSVVALISYVLIFKFSN